MQTFSKIAELIINQHLIRFAKASGLYSIRQTGSLLQRPTFDGGTSLKHGVQEAQAAGLKASTMFLDIKREFDNVDYGTLLRRPRSKDTPEYMTRWISNFISYRQYPIIFPGTPRNMKGINTRIPQGSLLSPILFIIYIEPLHSCSDPTRELIISYVDDIQITVSSPSWKMNTQLVEEAYSRINAAASAIGLSLSTYKTDLMHWRTPNERAESCKHPIVIDQQCVEPAPKAVKWLGFHFEPNHTTWIHFVKRLPLAQAPFERIKRLSSLGGRLTSYSAGRMAKGIMVPTLFYGPKFLKPSITMCNKMKTFMNRVQRWITNCFYSTNTIVLFAEAFLMPMDLYLEQIRDMATIR